MPQMSPMQWEILFLMSLIMLMVMSSKLFFSLIKTSLNINLENKSFNKFYFNWLW